MNCPFLRETRVWGCRSAQVRKLIPRAGATPPDSKCLTVNHQHCPGFVDIEGMAQQAKIVCPYLEDSLAQYCAAAPVMKLIPYSEAMLVRCGSGAHRYCDLYLEQAGPARSHSRDDDWDVPPDLLYTSDCWWIDLPEEGPWHAGLDAFTARLTGPVDRISFITESPGSGPAVVLTISGNDFTFGLPEKLNVTASNPLLRLHPERIWEAPYTRGWIYEGTSTSSQRRDLRARLSGAGEARTRMEDTARLINERLHGHSAQGAAMMGDGGMFEAGLLKRLSRQDARALMHALSSWSASARRK